MFICEMYRNNAPKKLNKAFPGLPGTVGVAPSRAAKKHQDQTRGGRLCPGGMLVSVTVMAARKEQGGQHGQQESFSVKF